MSHIHFEEEQRFTSIPWLWVAIFIPLLIPLFFITGEPTQEDVTMLLLTILMGWIPIAIILFYSKFQLKVDRDGLRYKFFPAVWRWKLVPKDNIASFEIRSKKTFIEKLTFGYRNNRFTNTIRMNITGDTFVYIKLTMGRTLKIGTNNAEGLKLALQRLQTTTED